ncbi:hypothetical protein SERLA73DRAFT_69480 [Serpula lacrymans var. lacrymans S7.3]|uniref:DUF6533 domain-containing protein n=1 Tax=Serpula lacrymans var. lacrymans (strain S7.3) TaxID=936435 RepID=F8PKY9_SERL3|nr:hypothetical protein SERLA73DRAFT_69480 [Serpula lacrymans var. lacrymans S7.3]
MIVPRAIDALRVTYDASDPLVAALFLDGSPVIPGKFCQAQVHHPDHQSDEPRICLPKIFSGGFFLSIRVERSNERRLLFILPANKFAMISAPETSRLPSERTSIWQRAINAASVVSYLQTVKYFKGMISPLARFFEADHSVEKIGWAPLIVVSFTIWIFDYSLTFDQEVRHIWIRSWGLVETFFFGSRYIPLLGLLTDFYCEFSRTLMFDLFERALPVTFMPYHETSCRPWYDAASWLNTFGIWAAEGLILLRTYALYQCSRKLLIAFILYISVAEVATILIEIHELRSIQYAPSFERTPRCFVAAGSRIFGINYGMLLVFELIIMSLTIYQYFRHHRSSRHQLLNTVYQDGISYIVCLACLSTVNVLVFVVAPSEYSGLLDTFQLAMHSVLSSHVLFNLRDMTRLSTLGPNRLTITSIFSQLTFGSRTDDDETYHWPHNVPLEHCNGSHRQSRPGVGPEATQSGVDNEETWTGIIEVPRIPV